MSVNDSGASPQVHRREGYTLSSAQGSEAAEEFSERSATTELTAAHNLLSWRRVALCDVWSRPDPLVTNLD